MGRMKQLMVDNNTAASHSFLLDDDSSIPFSLDDIQNLMDEKARLFSCALDCIKDSTSLHVPAVFADIYRLNRS